MMVKNKLNFLGLVIALMLMLGACSTQRLAKIEPTYTVVNADAAETDPAVEAVLVKYREQLSAKMDIIVGHTDEPMSKGRPESKLGNLISDVMLDAATEQSKLDVNFAIQNLGGIRIPTLGAGDIRKGLMYEIMPFDNEIVIVRVKGDKVLSLMKRIAEQGGVPVSRGIQMVIEKQKMASLLVNGEAVDPNKDYLIAVNDFMATGGDGFEELTAGDHILTGILVRDALTNHFLMMQAKGQSITARIEKRIVD